MCPFRLQSRELFRFARAIECLTDVARLGKALAQGGAHKVEPPISDRVENNVRRGGLGRWHCPALCLPWLKIGRQIPSGVVGREPVNFGVPTGSEHVDFHVHGILKGLPHRRPRLVAQSSDADPIKYAWLAIGPEIGAVPYNSTVPGRRVSLVPRRLSPWLSELGFRLRLKNKGLHLGDDTASLKRGASLAPSGNE